MDERRSLTAREAAEMLGVKPATLYAYVSRGLVRRERGADGQSRFLVSDLEELGRRARSATRRASELPIESALTAIRDGAIFYRGLDVVELASTRSFEEVACWLWSGSYPETAQPWPEDPEASRVAAAMQEALPADALPLDRLRVAATALAASDPLRFNTGGEAVMVSGRRLLAALVDSLPRHTRPRERSLAARLWAGLAPKTPPPGAVEALNAALILAADHDLSTSTLTARLAASFRADPYSVVTVGLSALGGVMQPVASLATERLLADISDPEHAAWVIGDRLRQGQRLPGLGHALHPHGDPRATLLLGRLRGVYAQSPRLAVIEALLEATRSRGIPGPNIDFALATLAHLAGMQRGSSEAIFGLARSAGWLAHAIEEYGHGSAIRPRAIYVGTPVGPER